MILVATYYKVEICFCIMELHWKATRHSRSQKLKGSVAFYFSNKLIFIVPWCFTNFSFIFFFFLYFGDLSLLLNLLVIFATLYLIFCRNWEPIKWSNFSFCGILLKNKNCGCNCLFNQLKVQVATNWIVSVIPWSLVVQVFCM